MNQILFLSLLFLSLSSWGKSIPVRVGGYIFPPYVVEANGKYNGLAMDFIQHLNQKQKKYHFSFILTSPTSRYQDFIDKKYDVILFESLSWGWEKYPVTSTQIFQYGGEVFITRQSLNKNQSYFNNLKGKSIKAVYGYHYAFLNYSTDAAAMKGFNIELTNSQDGNIRAVLANKVDLAIVTKEHLDQFLKNENGTRAKLLISKKMDQVYRLGALVRNQGGSISVQDMDGLIESATKDGSWNEHLKAKGIENEVL